MNADGRFVFFYPSGLVFELCSLAEVTMISVCWTRGNVGGLIKALKFLQLAASHLMAFINLAICINLALIVVVCNRMYIWDVFRGSATCSVRDEMCRGDRERIDSSILWRCRDLSVFFVHTGVCLFRATPASVVPGQVAIGLLSGR